MRSARRPRNRCIRLGSGGGPSCSAVRGRGPAPRRAASSPCPPGRIEPPCPAERQDQSSRLDSPCGAGSGGPAPPDPRAPSGPEPCLGAPTGNGTTTITCRDGARDLVCTAADCGGVTSVVIEGTDLALVSSEARRVRLRPALTRRFRYPRVVTSHPSSPPPHPPHPWSPLCHTSSSRRRSTSGSPARAWRSRPPAPAPRSSRSSTST